MHGSGHGAQQVDSGAGWTLWRTGSGGWLEVVDDLAGVLPDASAAGVALSTWPGGRWTFTFRGAPLPLGAPMAVRADPALTCAMTVLAAAKQARLRADDTVRATFTELASYEPEPGLAAAQVSAVLDVRAPEAAVRDAVVDAVLAQARSRAERDRTRVEVDADALDPGCTLDPGYAEALLDALARSYVVAAVTTPAGDRAASRARHGHRAAVLVLAERDDVLVAQALAALG